MLKRIIYFFFIFISFHSFAQIDRVEPPNWWVGFKDSNLQLLVYGENVGEAISRIDHQGVSILETNKADSPNYLFIDLDISEEAKAGTFDITFEYPSGKEETYSYELKKRRKPAEDFVGFDNTDAIYLITPDRFANGDPSNDVDTSLNEKTIDREDDYGRHGGDIRGIIDHLDYIQKMGFTALWSSPLLINDMESGSYHGYAITDFYKVDPRFGTLDEYKELADEARQRGIKLIMDQVANHSGIEHWWMEDLPFDNWINYQERYVEGKKAIYSNHRRTVNQDLYASEADKKRMNDGWFVDSMPDLNQRNPFMAEYIIQNSIWWIETLGLGGIRQDTYPYPDKAFMSDWAGAIMKEYPNFNIVGEEWSNNPLLIRYWQEGVNNRDGYESNLRSTMDFAMQSNIVNALNEKEGWDTGLIKMYDGLANDFAYASPENILIFPDNHDMSRIFTQLNEDVGNTKMALAYLLVLPRIPQIYYGTEILMENTEKPGDHGLIRSEFPGGWEDSNVNAFTGEGLSKEKSGMQEYLKTILNFRKESSAIHNGETIHFAPENGVYLISRKTENEAMVLILNKNEKKMELDLQRFDELDLEGQVMKNIISGEKVEWKEKLSLPKRGAYLFSSKTE